jgi:transposase
MAKGRRYSPEYKREAIELLRKSGKSITDVAKDLGIPLQSLSRWKALAEKQKSPPQPASKRSASAAELEIAELRRELERVRMERDFLKKAAAFFAKDPSK